MSKKTGFEDLIARAAAAIENRRKTITIHFKALNRDFEFVPLPAADINAILHSCGDDDALFVQRVIYQSCPELVPIAAELEKRGIIKTACDVVDMLHDADKNKVIDALAALSGQKESEIVVKADELKNE